MKNINRLWLGFFIIWAFILTGVFHSWTKTPGLKQWSQLRYLLSERNQEILAIETQSDFLRETETQLQNNPAAQEREIRKVLGFVDENEIVFEFEK